MDGPFGVGRKGRQRANLGPVVGCGDRRGAAQRVSQAGPDRRPPPPPAVMRTRRSKLSRRDCASVYSAASMRDSRVAVKEPRTLPQSQFPSALTTVASRQSPILTLAEGRNWRWRANDAVPSKIKPSGVWITISKVRLFRSSDCFV